MALTTVFVLSEMLYFKRMVSRYSCCFVLLRVADVLAVCLFLLFSGVWGTASPADEMASEMGLSPLRVSLLS